MINSIVLETANDKKRSKYFQTIDEMIKYHNNPIYQNLKDTYNPIYAGPVLQTFFEAKEGFGPLDPILWKITGTMGSLLMDKLLYVKQ